MKPVLVVVDVQNGFISEHSAPVVPVIADLVTQWQEAGLETIFTRYRNPDGSLYESLLDWTRLRTDFETDIVEDLKPLAERATAVVNKESYGFFNEAGAKLASTQQWTDLYACGIATESCVLKTAVDAFERGLTPRVVVDATASHAGPEAHQAGLLVCRRFIGNRQMISLGAALPAEVLSVSTH